MRWSRAGLGLAASTSRRRAGQASEPTWWERAVGYRPLPSTLAESLRAVGVAEVFEIGDGVRPARIFDAVHAGYKLAMRI